jgi:hypothetical protein
MRTTAVDSGSPELGDGDDVRKRKISAGDETYFIHGPGGQLLAEFQLPFASMLAGVARDTDVLGGVQARVWRYYDTDCVGSVRSQQPHKHAWRGTVGGSQGSFQFLGRENSRRGSCCGDPGRSPQVQRRPGSSGNKCSYSSGRRPQQNHGESLRPLAGLQCPSFRGNSRDGTCTTFAMH